MVLLLICLAPGPDMVYVVGTGIAGGRAAVTRATLGVTTGVVVYVLAVAAGLGAVVARFPVVLVGLQVFGAVYLVHLAWHTYRDAASAQVPGAEEPVDTHWFRRGLVVNLTNPKVLLFFLAFLPGFLGQARSPTLQLLVLGLLFQVVGFVVDLAVGWSAGSFRDKVLGRPRVLRGMTYASAGVFLLLAVAVTVDVVLGALD